MKKQDQMQRFAISWDADEIDFPQIVPPNGSRAIWRAKKLFAEIIHDVTALEGNPFTLPEIQTLLDGVTVGGRKVTDAQQVLNQRDSYLRLFDLVESGVFSLNARTACELQLLAARGEALEEGVFRRGKVTIGGTDYLPPAGEGDSLARLLEEQFARMCNHAGALGNPFEQGMVAFLHVARQQSFWDGNKRTGRLLMNGVLLSAGQDIITVPAIKQLEFNQKMLRFYDSGDGTEMMKFLSGCQIRSKFE
jgi:Fic family protein